MRKIKINFSAVSDAVARELLKTYKKDIATLLRRYSWLNVADQADLRSAAMLAVLEGHLSYKDNGKGSPRGWILTVMRWRIVEAVAETYHQETLVADIERVNGADPEQQFWRATAVRAIGELSPRHRIIVDGRMRGETFEEIGDSIGLSSARVHVESEKAFSLLRKVLGIDPQT